MWISRSVLLLSCVAAITFAQEFRADAAGHRIRYKPCSRAKHNHSAEEQRDGYRSTSHNGRERSLSVPRSCVPGPYTVTIRASGFKTAVRENVSVAVNDNIRLDIDMELGPVSETVEVNASIATVQAESTSLGAIIPTKIIDEQPLKGHSSLYPVHECARCGRQSLCAGHPAY